MKQTSHRSFLGFHSNNPKPVLRHLAGSTIQNRQRMVGITVVAFILSLNGAVAEAQPRAKIPKIGWLGARSAAATGPESFRREFRALGYVDGKNTTFEHRYADDEIGRLPALADELVRLNVDVLMTPATTGALALKNATGTVPIVFKGVADPVAIGLINSLVRPGGNITGFTTMTVDLADKRIELLKETLPKLSRVAVLWDPKNRGFGTSLE